MTRKSKSDTTQVAGWYWMYGIHAVQAALRNESRRKGDLHLTRNAALRLRDELGGSGITPFISNMRKMSGILGDAVHQGAALHVRQLQPVSMTDCMNTSLMVMLDQVTDPRNVGAIMRTAVSFGAGAVVTHMRRSPPESAAMAKAASGALDQIPYVRVDNLARAIDAFRQAGYLVMGLDSDAVMTLEAAIGSCNRSRVAVVLGSEGKGLRQLVREKCDLLAAIPLSGGIGSLNVSAAAAVALYRVSQATIRSM